MTVPVGEHETAGERNSWQELNQPRPEQPAGVEAEAPTVDDSKRSRDPIMMLLGIAAGFVATIAIVMVVADEFVDRSEPISAIETAAVPLSAPAPSALALDEETEATSTTTPVPLADQIGSAGELLDGNQAQILRLYIAAFGRVPDAEGFAYWTDELRNGQTIATIAAAFAATDEFQQQFASASSDEAVVAVFYENMLGRRGDPEGVAYWSDERARGLSVTDLLIAFAESAESREATGTD